MTQRYWNQFVGADGTWRSRDRTPPGEDLTVMRSGLGREAGTIVTLCRYYTCEIDDWAARRGEVSIEQAAEHAALALYGLHQQSQRQPMHRPGIPIGKALRHLRDHDKFSAEAVDARVNAAATTTSVQSLLMRLRGLVSQLRAIGQPLDYNDLMRLIQDWHTPESRKRARRAWALQYQVWVRSGEPANGASSGPKPPTGTTPTGA